MKIKQTKSAKKAARDNSLWWHILYSIRATFYEYADITKVNGMYWLQRGVTTGPLRILWTTIMITIFTFGVCLLILLWRKFQDSPTRMTIGQPLTTLQVPFPAITVCHPQSVVDYQIDGFLKNVKFPPLVKREKIVKILPLLGAITEHQSTYPDVNDLKIIDDLLRLNNISIRTAIDKLGTTCENFLLVCQWAGTTFPCFQEHPFMKWESSYSFLGACCSFNYHPEAKSDFVPFASNKFGIDGGVSIIGSGYPEISDGKSGVLYSEGFVALVHHPFDFAVESAPQTLIRPGYETFITVSPIDSRCSDQVLALPQQRRDCIVPADKGVDMYRQPACMLECVRDSVHRECQCHPYNLPRSNNVLPANYMRDCNVIDIFCIVNNFFTFKKVTCDCLPACSDVTYTTAANWVRMDAIKHSINSLYTQINITDMEFVAHIFYGNQLVAANRKIVVMSWINLLSNLGGAFNLCMGMSLLSIFEVIYFILIRWKNHLRRKPPTELIVNVAERPQNKNCRSSLQTCTLLLIICVTLKILLGYWFMAYLK